MVNVANSFYPIQLISFVGLLFFHHLIKTIMTKKLIITLCVFALLPILLSAQNGNLHQKVADSTCKCLNEKKELNVKDIEAFQMEMGLCMMSGISDLSEAELAELDIDPTDQNAMYQFGERVGQLMSISCPTFLKIVTDMMTEEDSELLEIVKDKNGEGATKDFGSVQGELVRIDTDKFATVIIKDADGKRQELVWLKYFTNSEVLMDSTESLQGKVLNFEYVEYEVYLPGAKGYFKIKEIKSLEVKQ